MLATLNGTPLLSVRKRRARESGLLHYWRCRMKNRKSWKKLVGAINSGWKRLKLIPLALLMICVSLVTSCASESHSVRPQDTSSQVSVDQSLMVTPNFQTRLLSFLLEKPSAQTSGLNTSSAP